MPKPVKKWRRTASVGIRPKGFSKYHADLKRTRNILIKIDNLLDKLETTDPYGDIMENFQSSYGVMGPDGEMRYERHTKRLINLVQNDLNAMEGRR